MKTKIKNKQEKPKWFTGAWYTTGDTVTNPFSGECYTLTGPELSMYDFIIGAQMFNKMPDDLIRDVQKALSWFRTHNAKAYMVLLD